MAGGDDGAGVEYVEVINVYGESDLISRLVATPSTMLKSRELRDWELQWLVANSRRVGDVPSFLNSLSG